MRQVLTTAIVLAIWSAASAALAQTTPTPAQAHDAADNILDKAVNLPGAKWAVYGVNENNKSMTGEGVPGGRFVRATVTTTGANARDTGATSPIQKPIAAGDTILVAIYLRAPELKDGETMPLPYFGANGVGAPYDGLVDANVRISNEWKIYYASGKAAKNFAGGTMKVAVHLSSDKQVIDLGPVFVLDFGQNYTKKLPGNNTP
jgi:hypothetical protein